MDSSTVPTGIRLSGSLVNRTAWHWVYYIISTYSDASGCACLCPSEWGEGGGDCDRLYKEESDSRGGF